MAPSHLPWGVRGRQTELAVAKTRTFLDQISQNPWACCAISPWSLWECVYAPLWVEDGESKEIKRIEWLVCSNHILQVIRECMEFSLPHSWRESLFQRFRRTLNGTSSGANWAVTEPGFTETSPF
jgi:hypothetical protein